MKTESAVNYSPARKEEQGQGEGALGGLELEPQRCTSGRACPGELESALWSTGTWKLEARSKG